jgi:hypothetical protein
MARTVLQDVDRVLASKWYSAWALLHSADDAKIKLERGGQRRPLSDDSWARCFIESIRVGITVEPPPTVPLPPLAELARNVMFTAWNPVAALRCPPHWRVALSADPAYDTAARFAAPKIRAQGNLLAVWGVQTQIGAARIREFGQAVGADFLIFQAETVEEFNTAVQAGAQLIVGNPNSWTDTQREYAIARGETLATLFEVYANAGSPWPDTASAQGVPVTTEVLGVGWGNTSYQLKDYQPHTPPGVWANMSVYLAENMNDESWSMLP